MARPRKPRVDPLVPTRAIDYQLGRTHVATPDSEVHQMLRDTVEKAVGGKQGAQWTPQIQRQTVRYGLWRHRANRQEYMDVMGHDPGGRTHVPGIDRPPRWTDPGSDASRWSPAAGEAEMGEWESIFNDRRRNRGNG